jgi:hypothetical protein
MGRHPVTFAARELGSLIFRRPAPSRSASQRGAESMVADLARVADPHPRQSASLKTPTQLIRILTQLTFPHTLDPERTSRLEAETSATRQKPTSPASVRDKTAGQ